MTPAQASGIDMEPDWNVLVKEATKEEALKKEEKRIVEVIAQ
jgi:hypothetical protein